MPDLDSPISVTGRRGAQTSELATSPALVALRRSRARVGIALVLQLLVRAALVLGVLVVNEADLLLGDLQRHGLDAFSRVELDERIRYVLAVVAAVTGIAFVLVPLLRVLRSRARSVPPTRRFRGLPGPGAALASLWWVPALWGLGIESRSNNDGWGTSFWADLASMVLLAAGVLVVRARARMVLEPDALTWRGPIGWLHLETIPERDVAPRSWMDLVLRVAFVLVGIAIWLMAFTVAGSIGAVGVSVAWFLWRASQAFAVVERRWPWRDLRIVSLEGSAPALQIADRSVLDFSPMLAATSRNEPLLWTLAELVRHAGGGAMSSAGDEQLRRMVLDAVRDAPRPTPGEPVTLRPRRVRFVRNRVQVGFGLVVAALVFSSWAWRARHGDIDAIVKLSATTGLLAIIFAAFAIRAATLTLDASANLVQLRGIVRRRSISRDRIGALLGVPVVRPSGPGDSSVDVDGVLVDREGGFLLRLRGSDWSPEQLAQVAAAAGVPTLTLEQLMPVTAMDAAFPGYSPSWERDPGLIAVGTVVAIIAITVAVLGFTGQFRSTPEPPPDPAYEAHRAQVKATRADLEEVIAATFPNSERDGGHPTGCVTATSIRAGLRSCRVSPQLRALALRVGGSSPTAVEAVLCRCEPTEFIGSSFEGMRDPLAEPGSLEELEPPRDAPRIVVDVDIIDSHGARRVSVDMELDADRRRVVTDVRCNGDDLPAHGLRAIAARAARPSIELASQLPCPSVGA